MSWNVLIVGLGQIGMGYDLDLPEDHFVYSHSRAFSVHPQFNLVGAVDPSSCKRTAFTKLYNAPAYESIDKAINAENIDLLVVSTPTVTHYGIFREVLATVSPRAILCEKPLSYSLDEAREMLAVCAEKDVELYVNYMRRSEPGAIEVKRRINNREIIGSIKCVVWYSKGFLHNGSHLFNLLEDWLGDMQSFSLLDIGRSLSNGDAEPDVSVTFEKGQAVFLATREEKFSHYSIELIAENGRLRYDSGGRRIEWCPVERNRFLKTHKFLASTPEIISSELNRCQRYVADQLVSALNGRMARLCNGKQAMRTLESMQSILASR